MQLGVTHTNTAASVGAAPVLTSGTIDTSAASKTTASGYAATSSSTVQGLSALAGLVSATAVKSVSTSSEQSNGHTFSVSAAGTKFVDLKLPGRTINGKVKANTRITLPNVGYVVLNQQVKKVTSSSATLTVIAAHVYVKTAYQGVAAGTQVAVGFATSKIGGPVYGLLSGVAYGANAHVGTAVIAGALFPEYLSCLGTDGKTKTNSGAAVKLPGIATSGTVTDTAAGTVTATSATGTVTSTIQGLNLLSGEVKAKVIKADVTESSTAPKRTDNSTFTGLSVAGHPGLGDNIAPNTKITLTGLGTLWLHRRYHGADSITVIMIQLDVTSASNPYGLKVGTKVNVGYTHVSVS